MVLMLCDPQLMLLSISSHMQVLMFIFGGTQVGEPAKQIQVTSPTLCMSMGPGDNGDLGARWHVFHLGCVWKNNNNWAGAYEE